MKLDSSYDFARPSSLGAANYYEMKPGPGFISLGVRGYQQAYDHTCGPAAVMSLLHWYGIIADGELNRATEWKIATEMGTRDVTASNPGTTPEEISAWLTQRNFKVTWGNDGNIGFLRDNLAKGIPTLVEWIDWGGHWAVVTGYHAGSELPTRGVDTIFFADPAAHWVSANNPEGITSFVVPRFNDMWFDALCLNPGQIVKKIYVTAIPI